MRKNQIRALAVILLILAVFSVIAFAAPFKMTAVFWLSYIFGAAAVIAQLYVLKTAFGKSEKVKSRFYGFPIVQIGVVYMAVQLILSIVFMITSAFVPVWAAVICFVILFAAAAIGFVSADVIRDEIEKQDTRLETDTSCITALRSIIYPLADMCDDENAKKALSDLADEFKYSDPVSSDSLRDIESELEESAAKLQAKVNENNVTEIPALCKKVNTLLAERNRLCKLNKKK